MKRSWFPILLVVGLLGLLVLLAGLQYRWLGQISDAERESLQRRLQTDTVRFAEDFNREVQTAYFAMGLEPKVWREKNWNAFAERFEMWRGGANYPNLIRDFYFVQTEGEPRLWRYSAEKRTFEAVGWEEKFNKYRAGSKTEVVDEQLLALAMPLDVEDEPIRRILVKPESPPNVIEIPKILGYLVLMLDEDTIGRQILPDLAQKYFSEADGSFKLEILKRRQPREAVFQTGNEPLLTSDASAKLLDVTPDHLAFFSMRERASEGIRGEVKSIIINRTAENRTVNSVNTTKTTENLDVKVLRDASPDAASQPRFRLIERQPFTEGAWTLNVQHADGSLEQFVTNTRRKNLAISFGILSLLAVSIILIFLSAQRAKLLAQRQIDFVSAVSHEFRTPLAVIYSAGENLSDGVIREEVKISSYGNLIKREGKKLSAMVEQILEFAGAKSGKRKFDLRETDIEKILEEAIAECQPLIEEKDFTLEKEIAENLPPVLADEKALTQVVQNLIANSIKYSNGSKWLKISAGNGNNVVKIAVEDKGIGIEKKEVGKIFEPFFRSKSVVDAQIHGNGLGLSLVKQIVEAHKGEIRVESEIGKGSKFTVVLKASSEQ